MTFIADEAATWAQGMANYFNDVAREPPAKKCKRNTVRFLPQRLATLDWMRAIENSLRVSRSGEGGGGPGKAQGVLPGTRVQSKVLANWAPSLQRTRHPLRIAGGQPPDEKW